MLKGNSKPSGEALLESSKKPHWNWKYIGVDLETYAALDAIRKECEGKLRASKTLLTPRLSWRHFLLLVARGGVQVARTENGDAKGKRGPKR